MKSTIYFLAFYFLASCLMIAPVPARADDWHPKANYPARVSAITFGSAILNSSQSVTFGSWTVSFDPRVLPLMESYGGGAYYGTEDIADGTRALLCANAVTGQRRCTFNFNPNQSICELWVDPSLRLPIPCPTDITFQH